MEAENAKLKKKIENLEQEVGRLRPKQDLADDTIKALKFFFDQNCTVSVVAQVLGVPKGMAGYHCGALRQRRLIAFPNVVMRGSETKQHITQAGREYIVKLGLV